MRYESDETIGTLIAGLRIERGSSQLRLAEQLCVSAGLNTVTRHEVSRWEREERIPSGFWLTWLAATLEVPREDLERAAARSRRRRQRLVPPPNWAECAPGVYMRVA